MVGFIDHDDVPAGSEGLVAAGLVTRQKRHGAKSELGGQKRILTGVALFAGDATGFVVDTEPEIKAAQELDEPQVRERLGHENEDAFRLADGEEPLEDETRLNGFSQPDFVRKEDARNLTRGNVLQNV